MPHCMINGRESTAVDALDRGLHYGDGLFETIAVHDGRPLLWRRHMQRLARGCGRLGIPAPAAELLRAEAGQLCAGHARAVLKVVITRGRGGRGYAPPAAVAATRLLVTYPWPDYPDHYARDGVALRVCATRLSSSTTLAGLKHLNRLEQVLARAEWDDPGIAEGLMLDAAGNVIEGTMSNLFAVIGGRLVTPDLAQAGVAGVVRAVMLDAAAAGVPCEQRPLGLHELRHAAEVFVCNSLIRVWPVRAIEDLTWAPGPVARRMLRWVIDRENTETG